MSGSDWIAAAVSAISAAARASLNTVEDPFVDAVGSGLAAGVVPGKYGWRTGVTSPSKCHKYVATRRFWGIRDGHVGASSCAELPSTLRNIPE
jgi:hypothetical protein